MHLARVRRNGSFELRSKESHLLEKLPHEVVDDYIRSCPNEVRYVDMAAALQAMGYKGATRWTVGYRRRKLGLHKYLYGHLRKHKAWIHIQAIRKYGDACELCSYSVVVDVHHLVPKHKGGLHELENLMVVCPNCHAMITRGLVAIHTRAEIPRLKDQVRSAAGFLYGITP